MLQKELGTNFEATDAALWEMLDYLSDELAKGRSLQLRGFFGLHTSVVGAHRRVMYDGSGGHQIRICPAYRRVAFRPGSQLRRKLKL